MLKLTIPGVEYYNPVTEEFMYGNECKLTLEHSLVSLSKWEAKWQVPFLDNKNLTSEQMLDYVKFMTITQNVDDEVYTRLTDENMRTIMDYIHNPMTATTIYDASPSQRVAGKKTVTAELIYYWMIAQNIPTEFQKWHLNRLLTLIRVCGIESNPNGKKMSKRDIYSSNRALNEARRAKMHSRG